MKGGVIALGLDSASPELIERWIDEGHLPNIARVRRESLYGRVTNYDWYRAETPWTTFLTGASPQRTGYWSPIKLDSVKYESKKICAFDFEEYPPFYAKMFGKKVAIFDMPQAPIADGVDGIQVLAWGTHSGQTPSISSPPSLWQELVDRHGPHPLLNKDGANCYNLDSLKALAQKMYLGIERRADICIDLLGRQNWDFFMTIFGEAHVAGHYFWHLSQPHPLYDGFQRLEAPDLLLESFREIDKAVGRIVDACPSDMSVVVFSAHGMSGNNMDLPSMIFLPEFLYRWNFPGKQAVAPGVPGGDAEDLPIDLMKDRQVAEQLWAQTSTGRPLLDFVKRTIGVEAYNRVRKLIPEKSNGQPRIQSPYELRDGGADEPFQCSNWFRQFWPHMKAFAIPSFSEGYIRINVKGRDAHGIVEPNQYAAVCEEICSELMKLVDAKTGKRMVERIVRTRVNLEAETEKSPDADLVVVWREDVIASSVESPTVGRIGPISYWRTGSHRADGFIMVNGPAAQGRQLRQDGHAIDFSSTFLEMVDCLPDEKMEGVSILKRDVEAVCERAVG